MKVFAVTVNHFFRDFLDRESATTAFFAVVAKSKKAAMEKALQMAEKEFPAPKTFTAYAETLTATKIRALHEAIERVRNEGNQYHMEWLLYRQIWRMFEKDLREQLA